VRTLLRIFVLLLGTMFFVGSVQTAIAVERISKPNIIFIMADDLGYGHLGCYGQTKIRTPFLDRMAAEGMLFTQCYAGCTVCAPCRSVLMTGKHMGHTSVRGNSGGIPLLDEDVTVGEVLREAGYRTGLFGKWGLGDARTSGVPNKQGFDEFFGYLHQIHAHFYYPEFLWKNNEKFALSGNLNGNRKQYTHDLISDAALEFIRSNRDRPFFAYLPLTIPHYELLVPEVSLKEYKGAFPETPYIDKRRHYADQPTPHAANAAMITHLDKSIGRIFALLKELKLDEKTIVFFTSDNGPTTGAADPDFFRASGPLRGYKRDLYEGGIRVPMIVRWPGIIAKGSRNDHVWYFPDVLPTLAELSGAEIPKNIDGLSAVPTLLGEHVSGRTQKQHEFLYWEYRGARAVRMGDWKGVRPTANAKLELYNLKSDLGEKWNVSAKYPEITARIEKLSQDAHTDPRPQIEPAKPKGQGYR
jgi:arylsulfatase A